MAIKKEADLIHAFIVYCQRCYEEADFVALKEIGFGPREMKALLLLSADDKLRLATTRSHFFNISVNQDIYWRMIDYINREKDNEMIIDELISNDAPLPLMYSLTGMGSKQFILKRRQFGLTNASPGRPAIPSDEISRRVWAELVKIISNSDQFGAKEYLALFKELNKQVPLRVIWYLYHKWEKDGTLSSHLSL